MKTLSTLLLLIFAFFTTASAAPYKKQVLLMSQNAEPEIAATLSDRDAIPLALRVERMYCYVADNHTVYQLRGGVSNTDWVELGVASSFQIQGPAGTVPFIDINGLLATDMRYLGNSKFDYSGANDLGQGKYITINGVGNTVNNKSHNTANAYNSYSDGSYVLIMGEKDSVYAMNSTALGNDITLKERNQFAAGIGLIGQSIGEALLGQYNTTYSSSGSTWDADDRLLTIGNGSGPANRSDALIIYKSGDAKFSGEINAPNLYSKLEVDSLVAVSGGSGGIVQNLNLMGTQLGISGGNSVDFSNWDTDASDDFSGNYNDLVNQPNLFSGSYNDLTNKPILFSGDFTDLSNVPNLYDRNQVDSAISANGGSGGISQTLNLSGSQLGISGGNTVDFSNWDTDASDDFSGSYNDLTNKPNLFSGSYNDLTNKPALFSGSYNDLSNTPDFSNWDTDASDDFSGNYNDLVNKPNLFSGSYNDLINKPNLFSGDFTDLSNVPDLYNRIQVDSAISANAGSGGIAQTLNLSGSQLGISGGNTVDFSKWDTDASDDFSGSYNDLTNKPNLFSGSYNDLTNKPALFSGSYNDLSNTPDFSNWDTDASDDFSGNYNDLVNKPNLFSGDFTDLNNVPNLYDRSQVDSAISANAGSGGIAQTLNLSGSQLGISGGNTVDFSNWDTDASDDFSGDFTDLTNLPTDLADGQISWSEVKSKPILYTQVEVDALIDSVINYVDSAVISQDHSELTVNRNLLLSDCGKTIYTKASNTTLTIPSGLNIPFNKHIEMRDFGSGTFTLDASAVTLVDEYGEVINSASGTFIIQDAAITSIGNDEFKILGLYE